MKAISIAARAAALAAAVAATAAAADTRLEMVRTAGPGGSQRSITVYISGPRMRIETGALDGSYSLFDADDSTLIAVMPATGRYLRVTRATLERLHERIRTQLQNRMEEAPGPRREALRGMMGEPRGRSGPAGGRPARIEATGETREVAGHSCRVHRVYRGEQARRELCVAGPEELGMPAADFEALAALAELSRDLGGQAPLAVDDALIWAPRQLEGLPMSSRPVGGEDPDRGEVRLTGFSTGPLEASLFRVPERYTEQEGLLP